MSPSAALILLALSAGLYAALVAVSWRTRRVPDRDPALALVWIFIRLYARLVHRVRFVGLRHVRPGPLIVVANHTSGVDPILIQAGHDHLIRWMMHRRMMLPRYQRLWDFGRVIPVGADAKDALAAREAIRALAANDIVGVFPEGGLERPPRHLLPFQPGIGLIISKSRAPVLPVVVTDTPFADTAYASLWRRSRAVVEFKPLIDYTALDLKASQIAPDLQRRFQLWTGWPLRA